MSLSKGIRASSRELTLGEGRLRVLPVAAELTLAQEWKSTLWEVQLSALGNDILPPVIYAIMGRWAWRGKRPSSGLVWL